MGVKRRAITDDLLRSRSRVILEVPGYVRLRSHAPSGLASHPSSRTDRRILRKNGIIITPSAVANAYRTALADRPVGSSIEPRIWPTLLRLRPPSLRAIFFSCLF